VIINIVVIIITRVLHVAITYLILSV